MNPTVALLLAQDGIATGAIYALLAMALVLVFAVTRIPFIPIGEFVVYTALTLIAIQANQVPRTVWLLIIVGCVAFIADVAAFIRERERAPGGGTAPLWFSAAQNLLLPAAIAAIAMLLSQKPRIMPLDMLMAVLIVVPLAPMIYRLAYQPLVSANPLVLFMVSIAVHFVMIGLGLNLFGPDGDRAEPYADWQLELGGQIVRGQVVMVLAATAALTVILYVFFARTVPGKALRAVAVNRVGAQLVGIGTAASGKLALTLAALIAALCGLLISPGVTLNYLSGELIGLKGFVAAVLGGFVSYPLAVVGAFIVSLLESYTSFWASALKEVIVFSLIVPILLLRTFLSRPDMGEH
ncbi:MAG: branched-chain amino acid ABC transporter permease [Xanthobacteraceae bacterium]|nr:branched-chain amino acid ABC transporter permease [Xanthobacteraceae bacterium]